MGNTLMTAISTKKGKKARESSGNTMTERLAPGRWFSFLMNRCSPTIEEARKWFSSEIFFWVLSITQIRKKA
jgi:hypothetical protein